MLGSSAFQTSDGDGPPEQTEGPLLPMRVLVMTPLVPTDAANAGATPPSTPIRLDGHAPEALFQRVRPRLRLAVPSVLAAGKPAEVDVAPTSLRSFRPDALVAEVKLLRSLLDGKLVLDRLRAGELDDDQALAQLDRLWNGSSLASEVLGRGPRNAPSSERSPLAASLPTSPNPAPAVGGGLDALLDLVEIPGESGGSSASASVDVEPTRAPEGDDRIRNLIAQVALGGRARGGRGRTGIPMVEEALGAQLGAIVQHPEYRRLERSFRALNLLLERAHRVPGVTIDVLHLPESNAAAALAAALESASPPFTMAIVDVDVDGSARAFAELEALAEAGEASACPVVVNGTEKLLGVGDLARVNKLDSKQNLFDAPHRAPWRAAVAKPSLRWAAIALNGVLLRPPFDAQAARVREATVRELPNDHEGFVWMSPAFAVAALAVKSFKDTGWPARLSGAKHGVLENLPVHEIDDDGVTVAIPTQATMTTDSQRELARIGILALASAPNSDAVYLHSAPTAYVPPAKKTFDASGAEPERRAPAVSLVDQLFVARIVQFTRALASKLGGEVPDGEAKALLEAALWALFENAPPASVELSVQTTRDAEGLAAQVTVRPRRFLGVALEEIGFTVPIG